MAPIKELRSRPPWLFVFLIFLTYIFFTYNWPGFRNTNEYSRIFLTRALIDHNTFDIDDLIAIHNTQDKSFYDGHFYSNKAPGNSLLAAPVYLIIRLLGIHFRFKLSEGMILYVIKAVCISLPSALFLIVLFKFWSYITLFYSLRESFLIAYALGTLAWPYSGLFYGHQLVAICLFLAFLLVFDGKNLARGNRPAFEAGFFCGLAFFIEYPTVIISLLIFAYAALTFKNARGIIFLLLAIGLGWLLQARFDSLVSLLEDTRVATTIMAAVGTVFILTLSWQAPILFFFILGAVIPVGATLYYHWRCFGGVLNFPYYYETYPLFALEHSRGIAGVTTPKAGPLLQLLFSSYRGIFFYSPFLLLVPAGIYRMLREKDWRKEGLLFSSISIIYILFLSAFSDWEGGWSMGPRHLVPLLPFWVTALVFLFEKVRKKSRAVLVIVITPLILVSVVTTFLGTSVFPYFPKEFKNPLYELAGQFLLKGKVAPSLGNFLELRGSRSLFPLAIVVTILLLALTYVLSFHISPRRSRRILASLIGFILAAVLLLGGWQWARFRSLQVGPAEREDQRIQEQKIIFFMSETLEEEK